MPDKSPDELLDVIVKSGIFSAILASIRALLSQDVFLLKVRVWIAGVLAGIAMAIVGSQYSWADSTTLSLVVVVAPFISSIWPIIEKWAQRFTKKKLGDDGI